MYFCRGVACECSARTGLDPASSTWWDFWGGPKLEANVRRLNPSATGPHHVFIDFKKAFHRVWHAALWATMKKYNISTNLIQVIKNLYNKATSA
ncbi:hypothetical protein, partial [Thiolapillus sp.]|uniref:hypothetical protein n=1 Tax=Thiolapillus sp. TaxID=2017437 RepID=UPI003AF7BCAC